MIVSLSLISIVIYEIVNYNFAHHTLAQKFLTAATKIKKLFCITIILTTKDAVKRKYREKFLILCKSL